MTTTRYTHLVRTVAGKQFSIHTSLAEAEVSAARLRKGATIEPFVLNQTGKYDYLDRPRDSHAG